MAMPQILTQSELKESSHILGILFSGRLWSNFTTLDLLANKSYIGQEAMPNCTATLLISFRVSRFKGIPSLR